VAFVQALRPITGERTILPLLARQRASDGRVWFEVRLPGRPNSHTGWIRQSQTRLATTSWHIVVDTSTRHVTVYYAGHADRVFLAIVGASSGPTPDGQFFVEEDVNLPSNYAGAPDALALSARSDVYQQFDGGPGQIAIHGVDNIGGELGSAASHGCIRLDTAAILWLVARIGPGVPVTITS
jgi:lipoprotein-anchoring transpeptidase ErfK/SrfK